VYSFGVLLYELLGGSPPFYPNLTRERVLEEPAPPLQPVHPAPTSLIDLVASLLVKDAGLRSRSLGEVAGQLRALLGPEGADAATSVGTAPKPAVAIIRPIVRTSGAAGASSRPSQRRARWIATAGMVALAAVAIGVFVALPQLAPKPKLAPVPEAGAPAAKAKEPGAPETVDLEVLAEEMDKAEQARGAYASVYTSLKSRGAEEWAAAPFEAARAKGEDAETKFAAREFTAARDTWKAGLDELQAVSDESARIVKDQLARGTQAIEAGQSGPAKQAFALVLKIDPHNAVAMKGAKRAASLDEVFKLVTTASNDERAQQWSAAAEGYRRAIELDPDTRAARDGLARVEGRIAGDQFSAALSQGLSALNAGKLNDARASFQRAGKIRPGAREVSEGLDQVAQAERKREIAAHRQLAEAHEKAERWKDALAEYEAALKIDSSLVFAQEGRDRATPRAELAKQLDLLIDKPDRLLTAAVRDQAAQLLETARAEPSPGPVLRSQIEKVSASLAQVQTPVRVAIDSDNLTTIAIHRVGALGAFSHREVELSPGHYTVVGTRAGFRDVRRELTILPGQVPQPVVIRCEEPI
jgi:tetratricopeptide (TPR) repeat protein